MSDNTAVWMNTRALAVQGWDKNCKRIDEAKATKAGIFIKPLIKPYILILDEATNYLDRESLGALSKAIEVFEGGRVAYDYA